MKIAQVAPLYESVPPKLHGGTERVVSYLTEELVQLGHDATLFAAGLGCGVSIADPAVVPWHQNQRERIQNLPLSSGPARINSARADSQSESRQRFSRSRLRAPRTYRGCR